MIEIGVLKTLTEIYSKFAEGFSGWHKALRDQELDFLDKERREKLRETANTLRNFSIAGTYERVGLTATLIPAIEGYLCDSTPDNWEKVKKYVEQSSEGLTALAQQLYKNAELFGSKECFEPMLDSISQRRAILNRLAEMPEPPGVNSEIERYLTQYSNLMQQFNEGNRHLRGYIDYLLAAADERDKRVDEKKK